MSLTVVEWDSAALLSIVSLLYPEHLSWAIFALKHEIPRIMHLALVDLSKVDLLVSVQISFSCFNISYHIHIGFLCP